MTFLLSATIVAQEMNADNNSIVKTLFAYSSVDDNA